ncbi:MAG: recombinase [Betaproteobacteria bacterium]|nr:recombinase [Betaproteobacteria bacterium]
MSLQIFRWISRWRESADPHVGLDSILAHAKPAATAEDRLAWLRDVSSWLRAGLGDNAEARASSAQSVRLKHLLGVLTRQPEKREAFAATLRAALGHRDAFDLLIETGMPREAGFLGEFINRMLAKVLPEPPPTDLAGLFVQIFPEREDAGRVSGISAENWTGVLALLAHGEAAAEFRAELAKAAARAVASLAVQVCAATLPSAVRRRMQPDESGSLVAWALPAAATDFVESCAGDDHGNRTAKAEALQKLIGASLLEVEQAYTHLDDQGVSVSVVYQLERIRAQLQRAGELTDLLAFPEHLPQVLPHFIGSLIRDVHDHRSALALLNQNFSLAARKVVERSAETGEHYITRNRAEYADMVKRASGGGAVIAVTTYVKFAFSALHWPPFFDGLLASINYAGSFVFIQFTGLTVATKQPAMTAPALAARMKGLADRGKMEAFVDEVANLVRSQSASIFGNVFVVFPAAYLLGLVLANAFTIPMDAHKASKTVESLSALGPSALFAAFTGVLLWFSSVLAGWVDNWFHCRRLGPAIAAHRRLAFVFGPSTMQRVAGFLDREIAGLAANLSLGFLLGLVPVAFDFFGLPVEVRHVTLSTGQLAAAMVVLGWSFLATSAFWLAVAGIAVIGVLNVGVSFALALQVAVRARETDGAARGAVYGAILRRLVREPVTFLFPKKEK